MSSTSVLVVARPPADADGDISAVQRDHFFELSADLLCVAGFDGWFRRLNPAWAAVLGHGDDALMSARSIEFVHPDDRDRTRAQTAQLVAGAETIQFENRYRCRDGTYRWLAWTVRAVRATQMLYGCARDVTESRRAHQAIDTLSERLEDAGRIRTDVLANVGHELRTPLCSIIGFADLLLQGMEGELTEAQRSDIAIILGSGRGLLALVNDILDLSKIEVGEIGLELDTVDLLPIVQSVITAHPEPAQRKNISLVTEVPADSLLARADQLRVRQVLTNLVSNAIKFTDRGEVRVRCQAEGSVVITSVIDTGIGIAPDTRELIFDSYRQADTGTTRRFGGAGLGLSISRRLVEAQGGELSVESWPGTGSIFRFTLPRSAVRPEVVRDGLPVVRPDLGATVRANAMRNHAEPADCGPCGGWE